MVLKRNITFHNDIDLRNSDVKFTFELVKKFGGFNLSRQFDFSNLKSISISGDLEVIFELFRADEEFNEKLADIPIISERHYGNAMRDGYSIFSKKIPNGMGPFVFEFQTENVLSLVYHSDYYSGRPFLNEVKIQFFRDERALVDAWVNGDVDCIELPDRVTMDRIRQLMERKIVVFGIPRWEEKLHNMLFNINHFPLSEPEVRKAIFMALNRESMVNRFMKDVGSVTNMLFRETSPYYEKSLYKDKYNPKEALNTLQKKGWQYNRRTLMMEKDNRPLSFKLYFARNSELELNIARAIKIDLAEININVQPVPVNITAKDSLLTSTNYESMLYTYSYDSRYLFEAFENFFYNILGAGQRPPNYENRYLNRLFTLVQDKEDQYKNLYQRFQTFAVREMPSIFLFFDEKVLIGVDSRFQQYRTIVQENRRSYFRLNPIENWFVPKELQKY